MGSTSGRKISRGKAEPEDDPDEMDREPNHYLSTETPCSDLPDGRTVVGEGRLQIILMPATYVPVPTDEVEQWENEFVDCLADILADAPDQDRGAASKTRPLFVPVRGRKNEPL